MNLNHIWENGFQFKIFISHKSEFKKEASNLKLKLKKYCISCFVAHEDIEPSQEWKKEIESAIFTADALVALMTEKFNDSNWTDQEIGIAYGRGITIVPISLGKDPYGFIGHKQGLTCDIDTEYEKIISFLLQHNSKMVDIFIELIKASGSFDSSNHLSTFLPAIGELDERQTQSLIDVYKSNPQVNSSYGFLGVPKYDGTKFSNGLEYELKRITGKDFSSILHEE